MINTNIAARLRRIREIKELEDKINKKVEDMFMLSDFVKWEDMDNITTKEELESYFDERMDKILVLINDKVNDLIDEIDCAKFECDIENPDQYKDIIDGTFKIKSIGKNLFKLYGKITITDTKKANNNYLVFKFPPTFRVEYNQIGQSRLTDTKDTYVIPIDITNDCFTILYKQMSKSKQEFISLEHIIHINTNLI
jgi:hypothetical protein